MMPRVSHIAILRSAALLVPAPMRAEWLAEWRAELSYVSRGATSFCFGSFHDALWLRASRFSVRRLFSVESPLACILFLAGLGALILATTALSRELWVSSQLLKSFKQFSFGLFWMYLLSLLVLVTLNPLALGEYPANRYAPSLVIRVRRWLFLAAKIGLLVPVVWLAGVVPQPIFPPAGWITLLGLILGLRWALNDQRRRCPVCLHKLCSPVEIGTTAHMLFEPHTTELTCARGHGALQVPEVKTSWRSWQTWEYGDPKRGKLVSRPSGA
jgi:hypothetical protein